MVVIIFNHKGSILQVIFFKCNIFRFIFADINNKETVLLIYGTQVKMGKIGERGESIEFQN